MTVVEKCFVIVLMVFGVWIYTSTISVVGEYFQDPMYLHIYHSQAKKMIKYNIIAQLYKIKLINRSLLFQLTESIDVNHKMINENKKDEKLDLIRVLPPMYQMEVVNKFFYQNKIIKNKLFCGLESSIILELLRGFSIANIPAGEFIYHENQPADSSMP